MVERVTEASGEGIGLRSCAQERWKETDEETWLKRRRLEFGANPGRINNQADKNGVGERGGKKDLHWRESLIVYYVDRGTSSRNESSLLGFDLDSFQNVSMTSIPFPVLSFIIHNSSFYSPPPALSPSPIWMRLARDTEAHRSSSASSVQLLLILP